MDALRRLRALIISDLIRVGWRPPRPTDQQADRIIDDVLTIGADQRGKQPRAQGLTLTAHELRLLEMVADGLTVDGSAAQLGRSPESVKSGLAAARAKLGARNSAHAVALAFRAGLID